jgi:hypothetical protein
VTGVAQRLKLFYALLFTVSVVIALLLRFFGHDAFVSFASFQIGCTTDRCYGVQAVYRVSFALSLFFLVMTLLTACASVSGLGPKGLVA